jgi:cell division septation protein DedD
MALVVVAAFNFVLGLLVGRGTPPLRFDIQALQKELAALREAEIQSEIKRFRIVMEGSGNRQPLDFYRVLKQDDKTLPAPLAAGKAAAEAPSAPTPAQAPAAAAGAKPSAVADSVAPKTPAGGKGPSVQVAALREPEAAERIVRRLRALGFAVRTVPVRTADRQTWYRVRVGPFSDRQAAGEARDRLVRLNYNAILVEP